MLNNLQSEAIDYMNNDYNVLITGPASGKQELLKNFIKKQKKI